MHGIFLMFRIVTALLLGVFCDAALEGDMLLTGGCMLLPLGLRPYEQEDVFSGESGKNSTTLAQEAERWRGREKAPELARHGVHAVLAGCPVGAAVVAHGRLCFANTVFMETTQLIAGAEDLRVVFDNATPEVKHDDPNDRNAMLFWKAVDGSEYRMRVVARRALYGGEEAFFLWMTMFCGDIVRHAAWYLPIVERAVPDLPPPSSFEPFGQSAGQDMGEAASPLREDGALAVGPRGRILLAEDNEINQEIVLELLAHADLEIEVASNGQEAVELFLEKDFDLILMDIQMPLMDGVDATRAIRASGKAGADTVPILAMTAHAMSSDRDKSLHAGMNDHLTKPIDPQLLYAALDTWLPKREKSPAEEAAFAASEAGGQLPSAQADVDAQAAAPAQTPEQDILFNLKGLDAQAGLSNVAGNRELYLRLLDRFANNYRNSGVELRDALQRMEHDAAVLTEAVRLAHTAKGVAANLGARALAAVAGELERAIRKNEAQEAILARYDLLLREVLDSIASLPKRETARAGQQAVSPADKERLAAMLGYLPDLMQADWYSAQQQLLALAPLMEGTVAAAHFREITVALEEFDSEGVAEKGRLLLAAI